MIGDGENTAPRRSRGDGDPRGQRQCFAGLDALAPAVGGSRDLLHREHAGQLHAVREHARSFEQEDVRPTHGAVRTRAHHRHSRAQHPRRGAGAGRLRADDRRAWVDQQERRERAHR